MDRIERAEGGRAEAGGGIEDRIIDGDELNLREDTHRTPDCKLALGSDGSRHLRPGKSAGGQIASKSEEAAKCLRLFLCDGELHERG